VLLDGAETKAQRANAIARLSRRDGETHLYDALVKALGIADSNALDMNTKNAAIVITDGADATDGGTATKTETQAGLSNGKLPVYALGFKGSDKAALDSLGELARGSGGEMRAVTSNDIGIGLDGFAERIRGGYVAAFSAASNIIGEDRQNFSIEINAEGGTVAGKMAVEVRSATKDSEPPQLAGAPKQLDGRDGVAIEFSEAVSGADNKDAYIVTDEDGGRLAVKSAAYIKGEGEKAPRAEIIFADEPYSGHYEIRFVGITDVSNEQNPLDTGAGFTYEGKSGTQKTLDFILGLLRAYWWAVLIAGIAVIALLVLRHIKKRRGLINVNGTIGFGDMAEFKHHFSTPDTGEVCLVVTDSRGQSHRIDIGVNKSFFVGRSGINNLSFDDDKMSRQHFVVEVLGDEYFVTDLGTTNGTYLNGVPVKSRRRLANNDVITAGREKFVFRGGAERG
jgi:hypothetical protein